MHLKESIRKSCSRKSKHVRAQSTASNGVESTKYVSFSNQKWVFHIIERICFINLVKRVARPFESKFSVLLVD